MLIHLTHVNTTKGSLQSQELHAAAQCAANIALYSADDLKHYLHAFQQR